MSTICFILAVLITLSVLITGQYNDTAINISIPYVSGEFEFSLVVLSLIIFAFGILSGVLLMLCQFFEVHKRYGALKKHYEKTTIGADDAEDKIRLLENKIATLEAALKSAMGK